MDLLQFLSEKISATRNQGERLQYRKDMVKAIISSYPSGTRIMMGELRIATGYQGSGVHTLITNLIDRSEISRTGGGQGQNGYVYTILVPGNTYDEERGVVKQPSEENEEDLTDSPPEEVADGRYATTGNEDRSWPGVSPRTYTFDQLEVLAMRFDFYNKGASVADFIASLKS